MPWQISCEFVDFSLFPLEQGKHQVFTLFSIEFLTKSLTCTKKNILLLQLYIHGFIFLVQMDPDYQ